MLQRSILLVIITLFFTGCATRIWVNPNKPQEAFYSDKLSCEDMANQMAWQRYPQSTAPVTIQNTTVQVLSKTDDDDKGKSKRPTSEAPQDPYMSARNFYHEQCLSDCLHSKGWILQEVKK